MGASDAPMNFRSKPEKPVERLNLGQGVQQDMNKFVQAAKSESKKSVTLLLEHWRKGDQSALDDLIPLVYDELRIIARSRLRNEHRHLTLLRTDVLVNEAYLRLFSQKDVTYESRNHFFGFAARVMRQVLVDYAREYRAEKRGGGVERVYVESIDGFTNEKAGDLVRLDLALQALETMDERKCRIVEMRYFAGLTIEETARVLDMSVTTLKREWTMARAWLLRSLREEGQNVYIGGYRL